MEQISKDFIQVNFKGLLKENKDLCPEYKFSVLRDMYYNLCKTKFGDSQKSLKPCIDT